MKIQKMTKKLTAISKRLNVELSFTSSGEFDIYWHGTRIQPERKDLKKTLKAIETLVELGAELN